jgi:hypothetical protein
MKIKCALIVLCGTAFVGSGTPLSAQTCQFSTDIKPLVTVHAL